MNFFLVVKAFPLLDSLVFCYMAGIKTSRATFFSKEDFTQLSTDTRWPEYPVCFQLTSSWMVVPILGIDMDIGLLCHMRVLKSSPNIGHTVKRFVTVILYVAVSIQIVL